MARLEPDEHIVDQIEEARRHNNKLWMQLLRVALGHAPEVTKAILFEINQNDKRISELVGELAK